jgi:hypothetical protein
VARRREGDSSSGSLRSSFLPVDLAAGDLSPGVVRASDKQPPASPGRPRVAGIEAAELAGMSLEERVQVAIALVESQNCSTEEKLVPLAYIGALYAQATGRNPPN